MNQIDYPDPGRPTYCARCATALVTTVRGGLLRPNCGACGWVYYAKPALGAAVLIESSDGVLLVQRDHAPNPGFWMLPAGFVEYGEFAQDAAIREAAEETGLNVRLEGVFGFYFGTDDPRNVSHLVVYRASVIGGTLTAGDDAADARFFSAGQIPDDIAFRSHRQALQDWQAGPRPLAPLSEHPGLF